jgi:hypothetical protein
MHSNMYLNHLNLGFHNSCMKAKLLYCINIITLMINKFICKIVYYKRMFLE